MWPSSSCTSFHAVCIPTCIPSYYYLFSIAFICFAFIAKRFLESRAPPTVKGCISSFLRRCDIPFPQVSLDLPFLKSCYEEAALRKFPLSGKESLRPYIPGGAAIAATAYSHLPDKATKIFISLFTACAIYIDDRFLNDIDKISEFQDKFYQSIPQEDPVLETFAQLLREIPRHFNRVAANIIVTSSLNAVTSLILDHETVDMLISSKAVKYPTFSRIMSGAAEAYGLIAFPRSFPLSAYIQALPELVIYINNVNDLLSFYKEEVEGESINRVSLLASCKGLPKAEILQFLTDEAVESHFKILQILKHDTEALAAYRYFCRGFVAFHVVLGRYKLEELGLQ